MPIAGFAGIVGSIASVVGFSTSNSRPDIPALTSATHTWSDIWLPNQISAEFECNGSVWNPKANSRKGSFETIGTKFNWTLKLDSNDGKLLKEQGKINKVIDINIARNNNNEKIWPIVGGNANETLRVWVYPSKNNLAIEMKFVEVPSMSGNFAYISTRQGSLGTLNCSIDNSLILKTSSGGIIYEQDKQVWNNKVGRISTTRKLDVEISLGACKPKEGGKELECSLKVMSKDLFDWSKKVNSEATITLSQ
ncbi:hypothetical protein [Mycoplasma wenyonii]|uniref:hypothetical protein n=1 Tax=Mycoplasma wenyonii TaxID=65123 RepID=UPI0011BD0326|nr:hypothetical protein [Mycoplasma wenyonii]